MLTNLSPQVIFCLERAAEAARLAKTHGDSNFRTFYAEREQQWLRLANSFQLSERIEHFTSSRGRV